MSQQLVLAAPPARTHVRPVLVAASVAAILYLCLRRLPESVGQGAYDGNWLAEFVARFASVLPQSVSPHAALVVFAGVLMSLLIAWLYERLLYNDWSGIGALVFVVALTCNAAIPGVVASGQGRSPP